jgi:hypothetical protein
MKATARLSGETKAIKSNLSANGWRWNALCLSWTKEIEATPAIMAGDPEAVKAIGARKVGCLLMVSVGGAMPVEVWRSKTYVETSAPGPHIGCDACGDMVPARRTPRGWLCDDCARGN